MRIQPRKHKTFILKIKERRLARGLTQKQVARKTGVQESVISSLETGRTTYIGETKLRKIGKFFNVKTTVFSLRAPRI